ncbi:hypothetical protein FF38_10718, partial [Lucilia cuprina]
NVLLQKLERDGEISRPDTPVSGKVLPATITDRGRTALAAASTAVRSVEDRMLDGLDADDPVLVGDPHGIGAVAGPRLADRAGEVIADGALAQVQHLRDVGDRAAVGHAAQRVEQASEERQEDDDEARHLGGVLARHEVADEEAERREHGAREHPAHQARADPLPGAELDAADRAGGIGRDHGEQAQHHARDHLDDDVDERVQRGEAQLAAPPLRALERDGGARLGGRHHGAVHRHRHHDVGR